MSTAENIPTLPTGFEPLCDIDNMDGTRLKTGPLVNVYGVIKQVELPIKTLKGHKDWKCAIEIIDDTFPSPGNIQGTRVHFFAPEQSQLPKFGGCGSVVILQNMKAQIWNQAISLLNHFSHKIWCLSATELQKEVPGHIAYKHGLDLSHVLYATWLQKRLQNSPALPTSSEFEQHSEQSLNIKDKYSLLKDVRAGQYCDLVGEIIQILERDSRVIVYLADYTPNPLFYDRKPKNARSDSTGRDGDEYGYIAGFNNGEESDWPGPLGKMSIQLTLFDENAEFALKKVKLGQWVVIKNCNIRMGNDYGHLEGRVHGGTNNGGHISIINKKDPEDIDPRYKDGLRRRKDYERRMEGKVNNPSTGEKHKLDSTSTESRKKIRRRERAQKKLADEELAKTKDAEPTETQSECLDLNTLVKCNHPDQAARPLADVLVYEPKEEWGPGSPTFLVRKFRANVRVTNFFPDNLEDFAVGRSPSEYDILSDHSDDDETDSGTDGRESRGGPKEWEWEFSLKVEDVSLPNDDTVPKQSIWVHLDNQNAQCLLGLDADDLHENEELRTQVRRQLEILWGDLEEVKLSLLEKLDSLQSVDSTSKGKGKPIQNETLLDFDDENTGMGTSSKQKNQPLKDRDINIQSTAMQQTEKNLLEEFNRNPPVKNKAFTCCIQEYGVKNKTTGKTKDRKFGMFGTRIAGDL